MAGKRCNPFIDAPLTLTRVFLMAISAVVFLSEVLYGTIRGMIWHKKDGMSTEHFRRYHAIMQYLLQLDIKLHPWLSCEIRNPHGEKFEKGALAICNHQSMLDTLCLLVLSPKLLMVTNERVSRNPIVCKVLKCAGFATVSKSVEELLAYCKRQTDKGYTVVIFPEGERSADCNIKRFHTGAFYIARELQVDMIPIYLHGTGHMLPLHEAFQNKGSLFVEIGKRIRYDDMVYMDLRTLANSMRHHYQRKYEEICEELENTGYFSDVVSALYSRIGLGKYARNLLGTHRNFSSLIDIKLKKGTEVLIADETKGVFSFLFALVHPFVGVHVLKGDVLRTLYSRCAHLPSNIVFIDDMPTGEYQELCSLPGLIDVKILNT